MNGASGVRRVRSASGIGLSIVWVEFDWGEDQTTARRVVTERLSLVTPSLPENILPVLAPMVFMVLMLDALMSRVWMSEAEGPEWKRLRLVLRVDLIVGLVLLAYWLPYFIALGR